MTETKTRTGARVTPIERPAVVDVVSPPAPENTQESSFLLPPRTPPQEEHLFETVAATAIRIGQPVAPTVAGGAVQLARADGTIRSSFAGLAFVDAAAHGAVFIKYGGLISLTAAQWQAVTGEAGGLGVGNYYVSPTIAGRLTRTPPSSLGTTIVPIGRSISPTTMLLLPAPAAPSTGRLITALLTQPVKNSRQWTTALAPNNRGGWNFITQCYNYPHDEPSQWVVDALEENTHTNDVGPNGIASNTNFQINSALQANGPARAANGRIFFPQSSPSDATIRMAYYDPSDEHVHQLPNLTIPDNNRSAAVFSFVFDHSGALCYGGTQSQIGSKAAIFSLDPVTLAETVVGLVGNAPSGQPKYAYYLAKDEGPGADYIYVAIGQDPWELIALNVTDGTSTVLHTCSGPGQMFISFDALVGRGWRVQIIDNGVGTYYWCADGAITAYPGSGSPPGGDRDVTPFENPVVNPPEVNYDLGAGFVAWRPFGSSGDFTVNQYTVTNIEPETLETLENPPAALGNALFGSAIQYNGFWKYDFDTGLTTWYGPGQLALVSQAALCNDASLIYICGYANGALYRFDTTNPWVPLDTTPNPLLLGNFHDTGSFMKYCYFLSKSSNGKLYAVGRRERDGDGSGVGSYDVGTATFTGNVDAPLPNYYPRGWLVIDPISSIVFSGVTLDNSDAQLLIFDQSLTLTDQQTVKPGVSDSGILFRSNVDNVTLIGVAPNAGAVYVFDISGGGLLQWLPQAGGTMSTQGAAQASDGSVWFIVGNVLRRIDATTFAVTDVGTFDLTIDPTQSLLAWKGDNLYLANETGVYAIGL